MITIYQDRSSPDQVEDLLQFMTFENKFRALNYLIKKKYPDDHSTTDMLNGIDLYRKYKEFQ